MDHQRHFARDLEDGNKQQPCYFYTEMISVLATQGPGSAGSPCWPGTGAEGLQPEPDLPFSFYSRPSVHLAADGVPAPPIGYLHHPTWVLGAKDGFQLALWVPFGHCSPWFHNHLPSPTPCPAALSPPTGVGITAESRLSIQLLQLREVKSLPIISVYI